VALPAWKAFTLQVPTRTRVIVAPLVPLDVHTAGVSVVNVTVRPEDAVAVTMNGDCASVRLLSGAKVIVWVALVTLKLRVTEAGL
jgi:hypothetical protein